MDPHPDPHQRDADQQHCLKVSKISIPRWFRVSASAACEKMQEFRRTLPAAQFKQDIITFVQSNQVTQFFFFQSQLGEQSGYPVPTVPSVQQGGFTYVYSKVIICMLVPSSKLQ
jgi:hypothetical protein